MPAEIKSRSQFFLQFQQRGGHVGFQRQQISLRQRSQGKSRIRRRKNFPHRPARFAARFILIQLRQHIATDQRLRIRRIMRRDGDAHRVRRVSHKRCRVARAHGFLQPDFFAPHAHSLPLQILSGSGILGIAALVLLFIQAQ